MTLVNFRVARYRLTLIAQDELSLPPYMANTLRGGVGAAFKNLVCIHRPPQACEPCLLRHRCPYGTLFETAPPAGTAVLRKNIAIPRPFVLEPPLDSKTRYNPGEVLEVGLVLIGRALDFLPYFLVAFQRLGEAGLGVRRGRFTVQALRAVDPLTGEHAPVYAHGRAEPAGTDLSLDFTRACAAAATLARRDEITLRFLTPTRLVSDGHLVSRPEFPVLIRSLLRRISSLAYFHCGERWDLDFRQVKEEATQVRMVHSDLRWWDWGRYSARQQTQMKLGGFVGEVTYTGPVEPFLPLLLLGTATHVGKACTFGHGRYVIV